MAPRRRAAGRSTGHGQSGFRTPEQGAEVSVHLATLPADGPAGGLWGHVWNSDGEGGECRVLPW